MLGEKEASQNHFYLDWPADMEKFKNILDDYNPDPFNPGPGFMFYGGFEAKL